ncbi:MAG TPA: FKBP-type peptidyl-prolyl cis-trans isomerase [Candidatus Acidoferrum sp.]|jgi:FKBP-type peptidyl-prolyl cis-trans isomerase
MKNTSITAATILAAGLIFAASANAQQPPATAPAPAQTPAPAARTPQTPAAKKPAAKPGQGTAARASTPLALKTPKDKASYAIGMNIGKGMHKDSVDIDPNILLRGLKDAMAGGKLLMTDDEAKAAIIVLQGDLRKKQEEKAQAMSGVNAKEGEAFLTTNKTKPGVVALPSGLQYKILKEGTGPKPTAADSVVCNYKGTLLNGTEFDSSYKRGEPATFPVSGVIKGWTEALQLMPVGSKWELFIPSDLAYGQRGAGSDIGPGATLVFEVELLSIAKDANANPAAPKK